MTEKIVIITGAGFSAPAKIPIQNAILNEMTLNEKQSFLSENQIRIGNKFLLAYIDVGIFLLSEYTKFDISKLRENYRNLVKGLSERSTLSEMANCIIAKPGVDIEVFFDLYNRFIISDDAFSKQLILIKEQIRKVLVLHKNDIILEDIFTSFDKTLIAKEHGHYFTYPEMDNIRYSIMRLFVYYFGLRTSRHKLELEDYIQTVNYVLHNKSNLSVITTNWDTIFELYLHKYKISIDLCLNKPYFKFDSKRISNFKNKDAIKLIKIHGSINWSKCLSCGFVSIVEKKPHDEFLFNDKVEEKCTICKKVAIGNTIQLQPEIITPTMIKSISSQLYSNLWREASIELSEADKVIFIGYSLPTADFEFRYLLKRNIKPTAQIDVVLIENDKPKIIRKDNKYLQNLLPFKRYEDLFSQNKVNFFYEGFGEYFKNINSIGK
jgi:NAD-dependent SIR2 family protein deacetylase